MPSAKLLTFYNSFYGPIGTPWNPVTVRKYERSKDTANGVVFYMPTQLQISLPGAAEELYQLPNEPLISLSGQKTIIKTAIDGNKGSFKEGFALEDYTITIRGLAINNERENEDYPEEIVRKLRRICEIQGSLKVVNELLSMFGITRLVIESFDFPDLPGAPSVQPYIFQCVSDQEFELELKQRGNI